MTRKPAIQFPPTPEHPVTANPELIKRLEYLRYLYGRFCEAKIIEEAEEGAGRTTLADRKAAAWVHERVILKPARDSIDELGPLSSAAQKIEMGKFVRSLEQNEKGFAA